MLDEIKLEKELEYTNLNVIYKKKKGTYEKIQKRLPFIFLGSYGLSGYVSNVVADNILWFNVSDVFAGTVLGGLVLGTVSGVCLKKKLEKRLEKYSLDSVMSKRNQICNELGSMFTEGEIAISDIKSKELQKKVLKATPEYVFIKDLFNELGKERHTKRKLKLIFKEDSYTVRLYDNLCFDNYSKELDYFIEKNCFSSVINLLKLFPAIDSYNSLLKYIEELSLESLDIFKENSKKTAEIERTSKKLYEELNKIIDEGERLIKVEEELEEQAEFNSITSMYVTANKFI